MNLVRLTAKQREAIARLPVKGPVQIEQTRHNYREYTWAYIGKRCWRLPKAGGYTEVPYP